MTTTENVMNSEMLSLLTESAEFFLRRNMLPKDMAVMLAVAATADTNMGAPALWARWPLRPPARHRGRTERLIQHTNHQPQHTRQQPPEDVQQLEDWITL